MRNGISPEPGLSKSGEEERLTKKPRSLGNSRKKGSEKKKKTETNVVIIIAKAGIAGKKKKKEAGSEYVLTEPCEKDGWNEGNRKHHRKPSLSCCTLASECPGF